MRVLGLGHRTQAIRATLGRHELRQLRPKSDASEVREHNQLCLKPLGAAVSLAKQVARKSGIIG
jgi:hypothetical protein